MNITFVQALLIGLAYFCGVNGNIILGQLGSHGWMRPIFSGFVVGLILGDPVQGTIIGAAINLPYLAFISAGGTVPMDPAFAGTVGTAIALATNVNAQVATSIAVPIGLLGTLIWILHMTVDISFVHMADNAAAEGDIDKLNRITLILPTLFLLLITVVPTTIAVYYGPSVIQPVLSALEGKPMDILGLIGGILPALGIAMNLRAMSSQGVLVFFLLGFLLSVYSGLPILALSIFAAILSYIYTRLMNTREGV